MTTTKINASWGIGNLQVQQAASILHGNHFWEKEQRNALTAFEQIGFPHRKMENWKYTNLTSLVQSSFIVSEEIASGSPFLKGRDAAFPPTLEKGDRGRFFYTASFVNGVWQSVENQLPKGVLVTNLKSVLDKKLDLTLPDEYQTMFTELNMALMSDGLFIFISKNTVLEKPIHFLYYNDQEGLMHHPRNIVIAEEGAEFSLIEEYAGEGRYFNNVNTKIELASNAIMHYYKLQNESNDAFHIANTTTGFGKNSRLSCYHFGVGGKIARDDINFSLDNSGAECEFYGLYSAKDSQLMDYHTRVDHKAEHTHSKQVYKGLVDGRARAIFNGRVIVAPNAQKITAHQNNANILLSKQAEIDTKPELEIYADDVQCTHGATVGQLDDDALFYLESRGIPKAKAQRMLTNAFAEEIINKVSDDAVLKYIKERMAGENHV